MSAEIAKATEEETTIDVQKRAFMSKFGKYAAVGAGMSVLMGPGASTAIASGCVPKPAACKPISHINPSLLSKHDQQAIIKFLHTITTDRRFSQSDKIAMQRLLYSIDRKKAWRSLTPSQQAKARQWLKGHPDIKNLLLANR